ncbi:DUF2169 domain-containing protein [Buttiauxella selenatireducens]|uniref:DUF2169 domain-containing protein n=1 Tax=Buttiauxella selenatireducens TaxID=3073902 RepID=A0ABY9SAA8_9ENTR|nr:DUF2169 domain-containing protein [Buttiauxella sp. R73]WMY74045.1 DUF2169 domain-containing protein [Buttiauxella sp. R73]
MWQVKNQTPYAVKGSWIRSRQGEEIWTIALKATWDILPGGATVLSAIQLQPNTGPVFQDDGKTLLYDTDFGPTKTATDVVLNGHVHSPNGKVFRALPIGLKVGNVTRLARAYGERIWDGKQYSHPVPFNKIPLSYSNMSRGSYIPTCMSDVNPVGISVTATPEKGLSALPNIEFYGDATMPGFGAVPRQWPGRSQFAGTYDENWQRHRAPLLPDDLDERYWQCTPPPMYAGGRLKGGEVVSLGNLTPSDYGHNGLLIFALPRLVPAFSTQFYDGSIRLHQATLHTVIIEPDFPRVSMVWHSALPCHHLVNQLESTTVSEKPLLSVKTKALPVQFPEWEALL